MPEKIMAKNIRQQLPLKTWECSQQPSVLLQALLLLKVESHDTFKTNEILIIVSRAII